MNWSVPEAFGLASQPGEWEVTTRDGSVLRVTAHGYSQSPHEFRFSLLLAGSPPVELTVLRLPAAVVRSVYGG